MLGTMNGAKKKGRNTVDLPISLARNEIISLRPGIRKPLRAGLPIFQ
jgi:hypothetical protein